jgi:O-antigen ligase
MTKAKEAIIPAFLGLCLLIGGSTQGIWANALLQLLAVAILAWSAVTRDPQVMPLAARRLLLVVAGLGLLFAIQLVPLPPGLWTAIPGRNFLAAGFEMLGMPLPWLPLSLSPYDTATTAGTLLPPLALLVGMLRLRAWNASWMLAAIVFAAAVSILLGVLQVTSGDGSWYFYRFTNLGVAVGTFANGNHFATLLLVTMPVLAALAAPAWRSAKSRQQRSLTGALAFAAAAMLAIGVLINGSAALLLLGPPVVVATALLALRLPARRLRQGIAAVGLLLAIAAVTLVTVGKNLPGWGTSASIDTRMDYWSKTVRATEDQGLTGAGFGTFEQVYRGYEDPSKVDRFYVNHTHNDYLEIALEGGIAALLLLAIFLFWWARQAREAWLTPAGTPERKAAAVASAAILLHSVFDYPLRTAAIMAVMAACLALLAGARGAIRSSRSDGRPAARHATL